MQTGIYRIHNTLTGDKYVGSAVDIPKRWKLHCWQLRNGKHHSRFLQRSWDKYGESAFVFSVVGYCGKLELLKFEQRAIDVSAPAFNMAKVAGSALGIKRTKKTRARMSASRKGQPLLKLRGRPKTAGHRAKLAAAHRGLHHTPESRAKMSAARRGRPTALRGRHLTAEHRAKIAAAGRGRHPTEETRAKLRAAQRHRAPVSAATRAKMSASAKARPPNTLGKHFSQAIRDNSGRRQAALSDDQVRGIRAAVMAGFSQGNVAQLLGIPQPTVSKIHNRKRYAWVA